MALSIRESVCKAYCVTVTSVGEYGKRQRVQRAAAGERAQETRPHGLYWH